MAFQTTLGLLSLTGLRWRIEVLGRVLSLCTTWWHTCIAHCRLKAREIHMQILSKVVPLCSASWMYLFNWLKKSNTVVLSRNKQGIQNNYTKKALYFAILIPEVCLDNSLLFHSFSKFGKKLAFVLLSLFLQGGQVFLAQNFLLPPRRFVAVLLIACVHVCFRVFFYPFS